MTLDQAEGRLCGYWRRTRDWAGCYGVRRPTECVTGNVERISGGGASSVSYNKYPAYQPLTTYWYEADLIVHSEFRDGNVPAGHDQLRVLRESLQYLPAGVEQVNHVNYSCRSRQLLLPV